MAVTTIQQKAYQETSDKPITTFEIVEPVIATGVAVGGIAITTLSLLYGSIYLPWAALAAAPGFFHGPKLYSNWIPKLIWKMPKGEVIRAVTNIPNVKWGFLGWKENSTHSNHFDENLADALVGLCQKNKLSSHADFECGGKGEYTKVMLEEGIRSTSYDYSDYSVRAHKLHAITDNLEQKYDLVTSFEVLSKTVPGQEEEFVKRLADRTNSSGMIAMSCALPGQAGPNSNTMTNQKVIDIFKKYGCTVDYSASTKLRRAANPMHMWLKGSIMVFKKA